MFDDLLTRWRLVSDGEPIVTATSRLLPVRRDGEPLMLKLAVDEEEKHGAALLRWWDGEGAARIVAQHDAAILMERATGPDSLAGLALTGRDDEASRIICATVARLHAPRRAPLPPLIPLAERFAALEPAASAEGGILRNSAAAARALLAAPHDITVLHGDIHHGNILDFGARGWLAIDPKGLLGERGFDVANLFCNPDAAIATDPARFRRRLAVVSEVTAIEPRRLLLWILAWAGLSAAWSLQDGQSPATALAVAALAAAELEP